MPSFFQKATKAEFRGTLQGRIHRSGRRFRRPAVKRRESRRIHFVRLNCGGRGIICRGASRSSRRRAQGKRENQFVRSKFRKHCRGRRPRRPANRRKESYFSTMFARKSLPPRGRGRKSSKRGCKKRDPSNRRNRLPQDDANKVLENTRIFQPRPSSSSF